MKKIMKGLWIKIILLFITLCIYQTGNCNIKKPISIEQVDSVEILCANPWTSGEPTIDRKHFEDIYQISKYSEGVFFRIVLTNPKDFTIFLKVLNSLTPLPKESVKVKPDEVALLTTKVHNLANLMPAETNDPISTNKKIKIFMHDKSVRTAYASRFFLDIDNWRYEDAVILENIIDWFIFFEKQL